MKFVFVCWMLWKAVLPSTANCGSLFELVNDNGETEQERSLHQEFFACSRDKQCRFVIQYKKTKNYRVVKDERDTTELSEPVFKWKKHVPNEEIGQSLGKYRRYHLISLILTTFCARGINPGVPRGIMPLRGGRGV